MHKPIIIDSSVLCYQAFFSVPQNLSGGDDDAPTAIIFGFLNQVLKLAKTLKSSNFIFCFDSRKSYRKIAYPAYKGKRHDDLTPEEIALRAALFPQFVQLYEETLPDLGFNRCFRATGLESDDLMASIVANNLDEWIVVTTDEDMFQIVSDRVTIFNPKKKSYTTRESFMAEWGIEPYKWSEVKAIAGCNSDNVEGISGVGNATAVKYLLNQLKETSKKYQAIKEGIEIVNRNRPLVRLPHERTPEIILPDQEPLLLRKFEHVFSRYDFKSFLKEDSIRDWIKTFNLV